MRTAREIVSDTSPIISLEKIPDGFEFIRKLYDVVYIPPAVLDELAADTFESGNEYLRWYSLKSLLHVRRPTQEIPSEVSSLDLGEQEAITLAVELDLPLLIEEEAGRRIARRGAGP